MDNITHTLAGLLLAESAIQWRAQRSGASPPARFRLFAAVSSALAANLPDADVLSTGWKADPLKYLLYHRGYTHTVVVGILGTLVAYAVASMIWRWRAGGRPARSDARWLGGLLFVSVMSHLLLDWTNSYGIHPFWPFDNHWYYGDAVFIVEPWLWVVSIPALVLASPRRATRVLLSLALLAVLVLAWRADLVSVPAAVALTIGAMLSVAVLRLLTAPRRALFASAGWIAVTLVMMTNSVRVRAVVLRDLRAFDPSNEILDLVVSPLPANPVCLSVVVVERSIDLYRVVLGRVSAAPSITPAQQCIRGNDAGGSFTISSRPSNASVQWDQEWQAPASELATLARESCPAHAGLRFMRAPIWKTIGDTVLLGDARYGGGSGRSFSDIRVPRRSLQCPVPVPPWIPPRADLIGEG